MYNNFHSLYLGRARDLVTPGPSTKKYHLSLDTHFFWCAASISSQRTTPKHCHEYTGNDQPEINMSWQAVK